jgi:hypothetical protein
MHLAFLSNAPVMFSNSRLLDPLSSSVLQLCTGHETQVGSRILVPSFQEAVLAYLFAIVSLVARYGFCEADLSSCLSHPRVAPTHDKSYSGGYVTCKSRKFVTKVLSFGPKTGICLVYSSSASAEVTSSARCTQPERHSIDSN